MNDQMCRLEPVIFAINLDVASSSKVFSTFDYVFLSIVLLTRINKFISFNYGSSCHCLSLSDILVGN